jgi:hypothetical protein
MTQHTGEYYKRTLKHTYMYTYIPWIQKFAKITAGYGIINKHTKYREYMELLKHKIL